MLADRFEHRYQIIASLFLLLFAVFLMSRMTDLLTLIVSASLIMISSQIYHPPMLSHLGELFSPKYQGRTIGVQNARALVDLYDLEAEWGFTRKGPFKGFKLHTVVNQLGLPLKAVVTPGNRYDSPLLPSLLDDLEAEYVLADAGYDSESNVEAVEAMGAEPVIAPNPRRGGKRRRLRHMGLLRAKRYLVEQFNGLIKNHVLKGCWTKPKGMTKKASMVTAGLISLNATAMNALLQGETSLKAVSQYCA